MIQTFVETESETAHPEVDLDQGVPEILLRALEAMHGSLSRRIVTVIRDGVREYRDREELLPGLERVTDAMLRLFVAFARGRELARRSLALLDSVIACRADDGLPLDALQDALLIGRAVVWQALVEVKGDFRGHPGVQRSFDWLEGVLAHFASQLSHEIEQAYNARLTETAAERGKRVTGLYRCVLLGQLTARVAEQPEGGPLINLSTPLSLYLVPTDDGVADLVLTATATSETSRTVVVPMPDGTVPHVAVLAAVEAPMSGVLAAFVEGKGQPALSAGRCATHMVLHRRYLRARRLLPFLPRIAGPNRFVDYERFAAYEAVLAIPEETRVEIVDEVLGEVLATPLRRRSALLATIEAAVEQSTSTTRLGAVLGLDKRTVRSYLDAIETLTRLSLQSSRGLIRIATAYHCFRLLDLPVPS